MSRLMSRDSVVKEVLLLEGKITAEIKDDMVVTITKNGSPLSRFSDDIWDYSATSRHIKSINFKSKLESLIDSNSSKEIVLKAVVFLKTFALNWLHATGSCSMSKFYGDINAVSYLVTYCVNKNISFNKIFSEPDSTDLLIESLNSEKQIGLLLGKIQRFADTSSTLTNNPFWADLKPSAEFSNKLKQNRKVYPETTNHTQTLLIPSRIYQSILKLTIDDLEEFVRNIETLKYVFRMRTLARDEALLLDRAIDPSQLTKEQAGKVRYSWRKQLKKNDKLVECLKTLHVNGISNASNWAGIMDNISKWQTRCAILISAFTGMRINEITAIPYNGLKTLTTDRGLIPVVWSTTTKLEKIGKPRLTKWVTASVVEIAFDVARVITEGILDWSDDRKADILDEQRIPLFLSVERGKKGKPHPQFDYTTTALSTKFINETIFMDDLLITEQDIAEISWFLYGDNLPEDIKIGGQWPLTFHQFRRSLAVYAAASGIVSYPTLKAQLKHISMVMTVYYTDSNSRAIDILGNEPEVKAIRSEWIEAKSRVESDSLHNLINSNQPLAGIAGEKITKLKTQDNLPEFFKSRKETKKAIKNGKIRYRSTLVGGCMSIKSCDKGSGILASACISCKNAVFLPDSKDTLEQTKNFYQKELELEIPIVARLDYESNIKKIDSFLNSLVSTSESFYDC